MLLYFITNPYLTLTRRAEIERARLFRSVMKELEAWEMAYLQAVIKERLCFPTGRWIEEVPRGGNTFKKTYTCQKELVLVAGRAVFRAEPKFAGSTQTSS